MANMIRFRKNRISIPIILCISFMISMFILPLYADAYVAGDISRKKNTSLPPLTGELQKSIMDSTPVEAAGSDLELVCPAARLSTARIPQGYTYDGNSYYYLSQMATGSDDLRLTRITWQGNGTYQSSYMTLKNFGHGTNLDCVRVNGKTWLWTGCNSKKGESTAITRFTFKSGKVLNRHGKGFYRIPLSKKSKKYATNVYPAIDAKGKKLAVRYTDGKKQFFVFYRLIGGKKIRTRKYYKKVALKKKAAPFQGFDINGTTLYTIEGTASKSEMRERKEKYYPIVIRKYDYAKKKKQQIKVKGASRLSHREPEGIQVQSKGSILMNLASHYKTRYTCVNVYRLK